MKKLGIACITVVMYMVFITPMEAKASVNHSTIEFGDDSLGFPKVYQLFTKDGKLIWEHENPKSLDLVALPKGSYVYYIRRADKVIQKKYLIVE